MIANIIYSLAERHRGPQLVHQLITRALQESGFQVDELYVSSAPQGEKNIEGAGSLTDYRTARQKGIRRYFSRHLLIRKLSSWLNDRHAETVVCDGLGVMRLLFPILAKQENLKLIVVLHMTVRFRPKDLQLIQKYEGRLRIVVVSEWAALMLVNDYPSLKGVVRSIPNALPQDFNNHLYKRDFARSELGLPDHRYLFGMICRLTGQKDVATAIRAFKKCQRADACLVIVGDGPDRGELKVLVEELGLSESIIWLGWVKSASLYLKAFDAFISSAVVEGFGLSVLEAHAAGLPVICSDIPPHREILGDEGHYFRVGDVAECAAQLNAQYNAADEGELLTRYEVFSREYRMLAQELSCLGK